MFFKKKVIIGLSGGVDSSVAIYILKKKGYKIIGVFMKNWEKNNFNKCSINKDLYDLNNICNILKINFKKINFSLEYWKKVFNLFLNEYKIGNTPNPDILCNKEIKFKIFLNFSINKLKSDYISTGHYVYIKKIKKKNYILKSFDKKKDQSYFLHNLNFIKNKKILFPIGLLNKKEIRFIAKKINLINYNKKDSTGICFIENKKFNNFINFFLYINPGLIITKKNQIIGIHKGIIYYTIGQRKGLKIGNINNKKKPWYVIKKIKNNIIVIQNKKHFLLFSKNIIIEKTYWINNNILIKSLKCSIKTRYRQKDNICIITPIDFNYILINLKYPVSSITNGQFVVFYLKNFCIGGGIIKFNIFI